MPVAADEPRPELPFVRELLLRGAVKSSRLEEEPGAKDAEAVRAYVEAVKMAA